MNPNYSYYNNIFKGQKFPLAYLDIDLLDQNIEMLLKRSKSSKIRIASKSVRCVEVLSYILKSDPQFQGLMTFTADETVFLSQKGFDDLLIAYPIANPENYPELFNEIENGKSIYLMIDCIDHLQQLEKIGQERNLNVPICVDLDLSVNFPFLHFGVWRSPITNNAPLKEILEYLKNCKHLSLEALMGYEAQIAGVGDNFQGATLKNKAVEMMKNKSISKIADRRSKAVDLIKEYGHVLKVVNGGGTGSIESTIKESKVSEVTVGSGFYNSHLFDNYKKFKLRPAAGFAASICRIPKPGIYTCHGGGYIASGAIEAVKAPMPFLPKGVTLDKLEGAGEVQTPIHYQGTEKLKIGDPIFFRHSKAGELCERFNEMHFIKDGKIINTVPTYRGEGKCFL